MLKVFFALSIALVASAPAYADPGDKEVVGVLYGKTYAYEEVQPSDDEQDSIEKYSKGDEVDANMRSSAAVNFRTIAIGQTLAKMQPKCDLIATPAEISTFVSWWQSNTKDMLNKLIENAKKRNPNANVAVSGGWSRLDEITTGDADVVDAARKKIESWKANLCVYNSYGGGRVHKDMKTYAFLEEGETIVSAQDSLAGFPYPMIVSDGVPLNGYLKHFEKAKAAAALSFPDMRYEDAFFRYYKNEKLPVFDAATESASITDRYWTMPVYVPGPK